MRKRWAALAATTTLLLLALATPALGHEGNPNFRSEIDAVKPDLPALDFQVLNYDADMELVVRGGHTVTIYGYEGEPYARILRDGTVQTNQRSPATYLNLDRYAEASVSQSADAEAPPVWKTVDHSGTLRWHDHRMHYMANGTPPQVKDEHQRTKVFDYEFRCGSTGRRAPLRARSSGSAPPTPRRRPS